MRDRRLLDLVDLGIPCALALLAAWAVRLPAGSGLRLAVALPVVLVVPGHLLTAAVTSAPTTAGQRGLRLLLALGTSAPFVGLLALATTLLPGGLRASAIVAVVTGACLALATLAALRRRREAAIQQRDAVALREGHDPGDSSPA